MSMGWKWRSWPTHFSAHKFLSVNILSNVTAAYLVFLYDAKFLTSYVQLLFKLTIFRYDCTSQKALFESAE